MAATQKPGPPDKAPDSPGPTIRPRPDPTKTAPGTRAGQAAGPQGFPVQAQKPAPRVSTEMAAAAMDGAKALLRDSLLEKRPYLKFAFVNPYNLSLFVGTLAASLLTLNPILGLVAIGGEVLWLLHAPDSRRLRHLLWDPRFERLRAAIEADERQKRMQGLGDEERERVNTLVARQQEIRRLAANNPSFTGDLLRGELVKTDRLVDAFIDMAITCARYEAYLQSVDLDGLDADRARWERTLKAAADNDPQADIAKRNLAVILRRQEKMKEIKRYLTVAQGQLDLIENSFQLIADQIVTMQSPQQLSTQLDELLDGVESIRQATIDTEQMLNSMGIGSTT